MKKLMILSLALILLAGILLAQKAEPKAALTAPPSTFKERPVPLDPMLNCAEELQLTEAQIKKFDELRTAFDKAKNTAEAEIENLMIDMHTAMKAENFSQAKALNKQMFAKRNQMADARIDFMAARLKELNAEQKEIMKKNMMQFEGHGRQMQNCQGMKGQGMQMHNRKGMNGQGMQMHNRNGMQGNCDDCQDCGEGQGKGKSMEQQHNMHKMNMK